jgi:hypothetical protein
MQDSLDPRDETREPATGSRLEKRAEPHAADREVPMPTADLPSAVHAWLDGDTVNEANLSGAERELALWKRISVETGRRRRMVTPAYVSAQILAKLADD